LSQFSFNPVLTSYKNYLEELSFSKQRETERHLFKRLITSKYTSNCE